MGIQRTTTTNPNGLDWRNLSTFPGWRLSTTVCMTLILNFAATDVALHPRTMPSPRCTYESHAFTDKSARDLYPVVIFRKWGMHPPRADGNCVRNQQPGKREHFFEYAVVHRGWEQYAGGGIRHHPDTDKEPKLWRAARTAVVRPAALSPHFAALPWAAHGASCPSFQPSIVAWAGYCRRTRCAPQRWRRTCRIRRMPRYGCSTPSLTSLWWCVPNCPPSPKRGRQHAPRGSNSWGCLAAAAAQVRRGTAGRPRPARRPALRGRTRRTRTARCLATSAATGTTRSTSTSAQ